MMFCVVMAKVVCCAINLVKYSQKRLLHSVADFCGDIQKNGSLVGKFSSISLKNDKKQLVITYKSGVFIMKFVGISAHGRKQSTAEVKQ
jgi:hypothetical protein